MSLQDMFEKAGYETRSYSGREMYGKFCLGVILEDNESVVRCMSNVLDAIRVEDPDTMADMLDTLAYGLRRGQIDSLGLGLILYFPGIKFEGEEEE